VQLTLTTSNVPPAGTRAAMLAFHSNDPVAPVVRIPLTLHNLSRAVDVVQPRGGRIEPQGRVLVLRDGEASFAISATSRYHHVAAVLPGGRIQTLDRPVRTTNFLWRGIAANGTFGAVIEASLATNGVPLWWLAENGLTNGSFDAETVADRDGDGMAAWEEFVAGTDPTNRASALRLISAQILARSEPGIRPVPFAVELAWASVTGRTYDVLALEDGVALVATGGVAALPPLNTVTQPLDSARSRFYRIRVRR
jgi:hypothetical protein